MHRNSSLRWLAALAALVLLEAGAASAADQALLDVLLQNGAITQAQYDELLKKEALTEEDLRDAIVTLDGKGLNVRSRDGAYKFRIGGRLHADASGHGGAGVGSEATDGTEIRRARLFFKGTYAEDFVFMAEADFADNEAALKDFFAGYTGLPWGKLYAGHQKQPFSLAIEMSSNDIPFVERGVDTDLIVPFVDRAIGVRGDFSGDHWLFSTGIYGDGAEADKDGDEGWGAAVRAVWAPLIDEGRVLHFGARAALRDPDDSEVRIRAETTHQSNLFPVDTGTLVDVERVFLTGPEFAFAQGPFSLGGEYNRVFLDRRGMDDLSFEGWHVEATWSLTGESRARSYKIGSGEFKGLRPARNFSLENGGRGAWELATRYASIDLNDRDVNGGRESVFTLALNWYLTPYLRVLFDWSRILDANSPSEDLDDLNIFQSRVDVHF